MCFEKLKLLDLACILVRLHLGYEITPFRGCNCFSLRVVRESKVRLWKVAAQSGRRAG